MTPNTSRPDFEALVRRAGLTLSDAQIDVIHHGWGYVEQMLERVRPNGRDRSAEPAHIFKPDAYFGEEV